MTTTAPQTFLARLESSKQAAGLYLFEKFLTQSEADEAYAKLDSDSFPWNVKPTLYGSNIPQHSYHYDREYKGWYGRRPELDFLESLCCKIEKELDGKISNVYCNRFQDPTHHIDWHKDTFGKHILVLSLGSSRKVEFRNNETQVIETVEPGSGDMYFMPLRLNDTHQHRVCAADEDNAGTRMSFVFFFKPPKYAKDYKITAGDKIKGFFETLTT